MIPNFLQLASKGLELGGVRRIIITTMKAALTYPGGHVAYYQFLKLSTLQIYHKGFAMGEVHVTKGSELIVSGGQTDGLNSQGLRS